MITILRSPEVLQACCVAVSAQADAPIPISSSGISGTNGTIFGDVQGLAEVQGWPNCMRVGPELACL